MCNKHNENKYNWRTKENKVAITYQFVLDFSLVNRHAFCSQIWENSTSSAAPKVSVRIPDDLHWRAAETRSRPQCPNESAKGKQCSLGQLGPTQQNVSYNSFEHREPLKGRSVTQKQEQNINYDDIQRLNNYSSIMSRKVQTQTNNSKQNSHNLFCLSDMVKH